MQVTFVFKGLQHKPGFFYELDVYTGATGQALGVFLFIHLFYACVRVCIYIYKASYFFFLSSLKKLGLFFSFHSRHPYFILFI